MVSHQPQSILQVCDTAIYLLQGRFIIYGNTEEVTNKYERDLFCISDFHQKDTNNDPNIVYLPNKSEEESLGADILSLCFRDENNKIVNYLISGNPITFCVACISRKHFKNINLYITVSKVGSQGENILFLDTVNDRNSFKVSPGNFEIKVHLSYLGFPPGQYIMKLKLKNESIYTLDFVAAYKFVVEVNSAMNMCQFYQPRKWQIVTK